MNIKKAIIPAAGFGTRFLPITKAIPKVMLPIVDKPVIHYLVEEIEASGVEEIIIITGQNHSLLQNYFEEARELNAHLATAGKHEELTLIHQIPTKTKLTYVQQTNPLGLGHAIYCARDLVDKNEMFAVVLGDDLVQAAVPCLAQLINVFSQYKGNVIGVQRVSEKEVSHYGIVNGSFISKDVIKLEQLVEKPKPEKAPSNLAIIGRYILHGEIFEILRELKPGKGGEIQLTDGLQELKKLQQLYAYTCEGKRYDIGDKLGYLKANIEFALRKKELENQLQDYLHSNKFNPR